MTPTAMLIPGMAHPVLQRLGARLDSAGYALHADGEPAAASLIVDGRALAVGAADWDRIARLARACAAGRDAASAAALIVLLPIGPQQVGGHERQATAARLRALALAVAPGLRLNAVGVGADAEAACNALDLILAAPTMTGQILWLDGRLGHRAVATAALARPTPVAAQPGSDLAESWRRLREPLRPEPGLRLMFIRDLVLACRIGVYHHERFGDQRVQINAALGVREAPEPDQDSLAAVVCYDRIAAAIRRVAAAGHVNLVETLAERIAGVCLDDARVAVARVRVEKLDLYADAAGAGVEIERWNRIR